MKKNVILASCDAYGDNKEEIVKNALQFFNNKGINVTEEALLHNINAWYSDLKSGFLDQENGYFLFSPCGCNPLSFDAMELNGEEYQKTYTA